MAGPDRVARAWLAGQWAQPCKADPSHQTGHHSLTCVRGTTQSLELRGWKGLQSSSQPRAIGLWWETLRVNLHLTRLSFGTRGL